MCYKCEPYSIFRESIDYHDKVIAHMRRRDDSGWWALRSILLKLAFKTGWYKPSEMLQEHAQRICERKGHVYRGLKLNCRRCRCVRTTFQLWTQFTAFNLTPKPVGLLRSLK